MDIYGLEIKLFNLMESVKRDRSKIKEETRKFILNLENKLETSLKEDLFNRNLSVIAGRNYNLFHVSIVGHLNELADWCLKNNCPINSLDNLKVNSISPVALSCYSGNEYVLNRLIKAKANIFFILDEESYNTCQEIVIPPEDGLNEERPPLFKTTMLHGILSQKETDFKNKERIIKILVNNYPEILIKNWLGETALDVAVNDIGIEFINKEIREREKNAILKNININKDDFSLNNKKRI